jgi:hypothetical protein
MEHDETRVHHLGEGTPWPTGEQGEDEIGSSPPSRRGRHLGASIGLIVGGLLAGTVGVTAVQAATGGTKTQQTTAATTGAAGQTAPQGQQPGGFGGPGGGVAGEQRVTGTIAAVGASSVTVTTSSGKKTYAVNGTTDIRRDGQTIALSALKVGETVLLHVYPSGSSYAAERILAGTQGFGRGGFGGPPPAGGTAPNGTAPTTTGSTRST